MKLQSHPDMRASPQAAHLKVVYFEAPAAQPRPCAAIWEHAGLVHLVSPLLRTRSGMTDPLPFARQFGDCVPAFDLFQQVMSWLDAACFAATTTAEVQAQCKAQAAWGLRCVRFDASDRVLRDLHDLLHAAGGPGVLQPPVLRECVLESLQQILRGTEALAGAQLELRRAHTDDIAVVELAGGERVQVSVCHAPAASNPGTLVLASSAALARAGEVHYCLLVCPALQLDAGLVISDRAAVTSLDPLLMRRMLVRWAQQALRQES